MIELIARTRLPTPRLVDMFDQDILYLHLGLQEDANKAIEMFNGKDFMGRVIVVNEARPMEQRAPRSDRGGFGGGY